MRTIQAAFSTKTDFPGGWNRTGGQVHFKYSFMPFSSSLIYYLFLPNSLSMQEMQILANKAGEDFMVSKQWSCIRPQASPDWPTSLLPMFAIFYCVHQILLGSVNHTLLTHKNVSSFQTIGKFFPLLENFGSSVWLRLTWTDKFWFRFLLAHSALICNVMGILVPYCTAFCLFG